MPYTSPPTFTTGNVLSAANLNTLSDDVEYLYGAVQQTNAASYAYELGPGSGATEVADKWRIRYKTNTLKYDIRVEQGTLDALRIKLNGTTVFNDGTDRSNPYTYAGTVDITSLGLTLGTWYTLTVEADGEPGSSVNSCVVYDLRLI